MVELELAMLMGLLVLGFAGVEKAIDRLTKAIKERAERGGEGKP